MSTLKKFWSFLKEDSIYSLIVVLIIAAIVIRYVFFPLLSFLTGSALPLVIVESCSMHHYEYGFEKIFDASKIYQNNNISLEDTKGWTFQDGFNKGDVIFVVGADNVKIGDVIIFNAGARYPLIHRVVSIGEDENGIFYSTKGDNRITNYNQLSSEKKIYQDQLIGKALFRVPYIGWIKLVFFELSRDPSDRGFC